MSELTPVEAKIEELEARLAAMTLNYHGARDMAVHAEFDRDHYELVKQQLATVTQKWRDCQHEVNDALDRNNSTQQQLAEAHAHLEAQRTATYQAVEREHAAKRELAELKEKQP